MYVDLCTILSCCQHNRQNKYYIEYLAMYKIVIVRLTILAPFLHHMNFCNLSFFYVWCEPPLEWHGASYWQLWYYLYFYSSNPSVQAWPLQLSNGVMILFHSQNCDPWWPGHRQTRILVCHYWPYGQSDPMIRTTLLLIIYIKHTIYIFSCILLKHKIHW